MIGPNDRLLRYLAAVQAARVEGGTAANRAGYDPIEALLAEGVAVGAGLAGPDAEGCLAVTEAGRRWARGQMLALMPLMRAAGLIAPPDPATATSQEERGHVG